MILIVPCYNEEKRLPVSGFIADEQLFEAIIFVNDGSTDNTQRILEELQKQIEQHRCFVKALNTNVGKGEAIREGVLHYFRDIVPQGQELTSSIGITDADLSTPLKEMHRLGTVHRDSHLDICQGARVALMGRNIQRSALKHYLGRVGATLISEFLDLPIYDTQAGAKVISAGVAQSLFEPPFVSRWLFDCELYLRARQANLTIAEEPMTTWIDQSRGSKVGLNAYLGALLDLARIYIKYK